MKILKKKTVSGRIDEFLEPIFKPEQDQDVPSASTVKLSVLKLDGTLFNVVVLDTALVADLKSVLEATVNELQVKSMGYSDIRWDQVWGNFCLCYMNHKLLDDKATLRSIGIQHHDQIKFVRHVAGQKGHKRRWSLGGCFTSSIPVEHSFRIHSRGEEESS